MTPARLQKIDELFQAAVALPPNERSALLDKSCADDASLRREVEALLAADSETDDFAQIAKGMAAEWAATNDHPDLVGQTFGRYKIIAPLAAGGMGEVFLAEDLTLHRKAAIKFLPRKFTRDADRLRRFEQEARAASALNHPNIITIYEIGEWEGTHFIATEFIEGETLNDAVKKTRLPFAQVLEIGCQTAAALTAAHAAGIVHRDIKPANIMLRADGYIKVLDFGIAKLASTTAQLDVTEPGRIMGTVNYMSPEQALGKPLDQRTDIFSLGVVLYEIATGRRLFAGDSEAATYDHILNQEPPPMREVDPALPEEFDLVVRRALEKDPERRFQSATDLRNDLRRLASGSEQTEAAKVSSSLEGARRRSRNWRFAALAALLLTFVAGVFFVGHQTAGNPGAAPPDEIPHKSIAVLPFKNRSDHRENAYFADGIQDEILTRLSKIADLKVISRTSTQHYKSAPENLPEIARQLGVAHILVGSVQKSGKAVRVNVQLIKAANNSHLWADTFDRKLTDIFSVETEVAKAIAEQLRVHLTGQEEQVIAAKPTDNPDAYDAYLRGLAYTLKTLNTPANALGAQKYLREAVRLDPKFALAWALLSSVEARGYLTLALQPTAALREEARQAAETALTLQPNLGEAVLAQGYYHYSCLKDYDTAVRLFEQARQLLPNSSRIPESLAYVARRRGQWDRSESYFNEAERLDPRNVSLLTQRALSDIDRRRFPEALRKLDQVLNITPDDLNALVRKAAIAQAQGNLPLASALLSPLRPNAADSNALETQVYQAILERRPAQMIARLEEILSQPDPALGFINGELRFWLGWAQEVAGDGAAAQQSWRQARSELEPFLKEQPENYNLMGDLALTNMGLGDKAAALALPERAMVAIPIEKDALDGAGPIEMLARVAARGGDPGRAIAALEKLLSIPGGGALGASTPLTPALLRLDPMFDSLRDDPRFQRLCEDGR